MEPPVNYSFFTPCKSTYCPKSLFLITYYAITPITPIFKKIKKIILFFPKKLYRTPFFI